MSPPSIISSIQQSACSSKEDSSSSASPSPKLIGRSEDAYGESTPHRKRRKVESPFTEITNVLRETLEEIKTQENEIKRSNDIIVELLREWTNK